MIDFEESAELVELVISLPFDDKVGGTSLLDMMRKFL